MKALDVIISHVVNNSDYFADKENIALYPSLVDMLQDSLCCEEENFEEHGRYSHEELKAAIVFINAIVLA